MLGRGAQKSNCHTTVSRVSSFQVLDALQNPGATIMKVAEKFGISKSQVGRMKQSKEPLRELQQSPSILGKKRKRDQEQNDVGGALAGL
ncbi:hypothetical protein ElyMa_006370400 [Elysia marginata]|uniref:HTH psq-type domain-containing protein n=1 Tax=Elysia marginata TaxID=1093978 RepID=A0AAV4HN16_9GAST|nr:hypothetical protein ElyMa_006370400 [Elysia marginata]